jgi:alpha-L-fucosidase 2
MDTQILSALFAAFDQSSSILGRDAQLRHAALTAMRRLPPQQIGARGQLQKWVADYGEAEPEHRHVSHLWALYPGNDISPARTPALAAAARRTMELRGDGGTGWAKAWKIAFWARLLDGDHAHAMLVSQIADSTLPNMFDNHPPFQIDGNFGGAAAMAEMLAQSDEREIILLPALPRAWPQGRVTGLRVRGGVALDITWDAGVLTGVTLTAQGARNVSLRLGQKTVRLRLTAGRPLVLDAGLQAAR